MDEVLKNSIKSFIAKERRAQTSGRSRVYEPTDLDLFYWVTGELSGDRRHKMEDYLLNHPQERELIKRAKAMLGREGEASTISVPRDLVHKAQSLVSPAIKRALASGHCPHCGKGISPFKSPPSRQKMQIALFVALGVVFIGLSFAAPRYFIQWVVLGALCFMKAIVDGKSIKTQILVYKALSDENIKESDRLHRTKAHL